MQWTAGGIVGNIFQSSYYTYLIAFRYNLKIKNWNSKTHKQLKGYLFGSKGNIVVVIGRIVQADRSGPLNTRYCVVVTFLKKPSSKLFNFNIIQLPSVVVSIYHKYIHILYIFYGIKTAPAK
jgi:hypothetical protein